MSQMIMNPLVAFDRIDLRDANACLIEWGHKMGPLSRPMSGDRPFALYFDGQPVAVVIHSTLIQPGVAGLPGVGRDDAVEVSRLCADRPTLCRVALRMWREFVFPGLPQRMAVSYQDAKLHNGNIYRFDGWRRVAFSHSGTDRRSGRKGRDKWVWVWPPEAQA